MINARKDDGEVTAAVPGMKWTYESTIDLLSNPHEIKSWREQMADDTALMGMKRASVTQKPDEGKF